MPQTQKRTEELLSKANSLSVVPGVYIMRDRHGKIIYVGKSRALKHRVSQYFQNSQKQIKTARMVAAVESFDYILCKTEIEALSLENSLIKQYSPKYNIRLKDAKNYPYIKVTSEEYPRIIFTRSRLSDKAKYFGPFSGTSVAFSILDILHKSLGIPNCKRSFPRDIGKDRPCIYYQMRQCCGLCTGNVSREEYEALVRCAMDILRGNTATATRMLEEKMLMFAEQEQFEAAARCRDAMRALERLHQKQSVVASPDVNMDVFGIFADEISTAVSAMYVRNGNVSDTKDWIFGADTIADSSAWVSFLVEHYMLHDDIPQTILLSFDPDEDDRLALEEFLSQRAGRRITVKKPERGTFRSLCEVAEGNAKEKARQSLLEAQRDESVLITLASLLALESVPERIEAFDISNIGAENITAGMVVYVNGKPAKSDYRSFNIKSVTDAPDDYRSMQEAVSRRIRHLKEDTSGAFAQYPDLWLIDGGRGHVSAVKEILAQEGIDIPVFGMVKDEYHKTRALCTDTEEINIAREKAVFMLIYRIQESVHNFTVGKTTKAKGKTMKHSALEKIHGIGPAKAKQLRTSLGSYAAIKEASVEQLAAVKGISKEDANTIYRYFHK